MIKTELLHIFRLLCIFVLGCVSKKCVNLGQMEDLSDFTIQYGLVIGFMAL